MFFSGLSGHSIEGPSLRILDCQWISVTLPSIRNALLEDLRPVVDSADFRRQLKIYYITYNVNCFIDSYNASVFKTELEISLIRRQTSLFRLQMLSMEDGRLPFEQLLVTYTNTVAVGDIFQIDRSQCCFMSPTDLL